MCWTICGLTSGYISQATGTEIYVLEDCCLSRGAAACHLVGRTREEWGDAKAEELRFFEEKRLSDCLDVSLRQVTETLLESELFGHSRGELCRSERSVASARTRTERLGSRVELEDLPEEVRQAVPVPILADGSVRPLEDIVKEYIQAALELNGGNRTRTAEQLHIGAATLYRKLKGYGVEGTGPSGRG